MNSTVENHILELQPDAVRFEPVSKLTNVFYDEANYQVFAVRSGGTTGVVVKGPFEKTSYSFRMLDKGDVMSIKFSPDKKILSVQRSYKSIEFINFDGEPDTVEYSQTCKGKNMKILGFSWTHVNEVVFVMDKAVELYQVIPEKKTLKTLKTYSNSVNWYVFHPDNSYLLLSSGSFCNVMYPYQFRPGNAYKLSKFEIDLPVSPKAQKTSLLERDVRVFTLYNKTCIFVLRHQPRSVGTTGAEIVIYTVINNGPPRKTDILRLDRSGRFAINVVDDVIIVHHQASMESALYDIKLPCDFDGYVNYHVPLIKCPIKPFVVKVPSMPGHTVESEISCELYSPNWVVFLPNIIIDPKLGYLWNVILHKEPLLDLITDKNQLVDFLLLRANSKSLVLQVCHTAMTPGNTLPLSSLAKIFDKLNAVYKEIADSQKVDPKNSGSTTYHSTVMVDQSDMYSRVFSVFEGEDFDAKFASAVLLEYIRSLAQYQQSVQHFLCKLIINILVRTGQFYQLHQFLQYHILKDSKQLVCLLLSLQGVYPPAYQLALDMMRRLLGASDEISSSVTDVLLSRDKVLQALVFMRSCGMADGLSAQKYLSAASQSGDPKVFYAVYRFFEQRNLRLRGSPDFERSEHCESFVKYFSSNFEVLSLPDGVESAK